LFAVLSPGAAHYFFVLENHTTKFYKRRDPFASPLWKVVNRYYDEFERVYPERYEKTYGYWRPVTGDVIAKFLTCGDLREGFARVRCGISKKGRAPLRKVLYQIIFTAIRKNGLYHDYYKSKKNHSSGNKIMVACMRNLLRVFLGVYKSDQKYDSNRVFTCKAAYESLEEAS